MNDKVVDGGIWLATLDIVRVINVKTLKNTSWEDGVSKITSERWGSKSGGAMQ